MDLTEYPHASVHIIQDDDENVVVGVEDHTTECSSHLMKMAVALAHILTNEHDYVQEVYASMVAEQVGQTVH